MLKELTTKEVKTILSKDNNVYGIANFGDDVYKIPNLGFTGLKGATKFINTLRQQVNNLSKTVLNKHK